MVVSYFELRLQIGGDGRASLSWPSEKEVIIEVRSWSRYFKQDRYAFPLPTKSKKQTTYLIRCFFCRLIYIKGFCVCFDFRLFTTGKNVTFPFMGSRAKTQMKAASIFLGFVLLVMVGYVDYITGYELTFFLFYLLPILYVLRCLGSGAAFIMAGASSLVWLFVNIAAGELYPDLLTPIWNTSNRLAVYLLVIILFSNREQLKKSVEERTESLRQEILERNRLEKELLKVVEAEQRRIGHDLHDSLGQHLTATALAGKVLAKRLANKSTVEPAMADRMVAMVEEAIELTRNLAHSLHPVEMGVDGLGGALLNLATNLSKAFSVSCRLQHNGAVVLDDPKASIHLYRIAHEAASNAIRHGCARNVVISLDATSKSIMLSVTDDGTGLPADTRTNKGMGLRIMDYRADMIGATFDIQNLPAGGARAVCVLPLRLTDAENYVNKG